MSTLRLNAAAIRDRRLPVAQVQPPWHEVVTAAAAKPLLITRRDVLKMAGMTAAVVTGAISARGLEPLLDAEYDVASAGAWLRSGPFRAVLDPSQWGGSARLRVANNGSWAAVLEGARFPGTTLPSELQLAVMGAGALARLDIRHALGGFSASVGLADWLAGNAKAESGVRLDGLVVPLNDGSRLVLDGKAVATLSPDWSLRIEGPGIARLTGHGADIVADVVTIGLAEQGRESLLSRRIARRSVISLERGTRTWEFSAPDLGGAGALHLGAEGVASVTIEAAETRAGTMHHALLALSSEGGASAYVPERSMERGDTALPLVNLRVARLLDGSHRYHVAADLAEQPVWLRAAGATMLVGPTATTPPLELAGNGSKARVTLEPSVLGFALPGLDGAIVAPAMYAADEMPTLRIGDASGSRGARRASAVGPLIVLPPIDINPLPIVLPMAPISITRPDDMLVLNFKFFNMKYVAGIPGKVARLNAQYPSYIVVTFPPQHILERAYRDTQTPPTTPFQAYLSDESRVAFRVPDAMADAGIPFTIDDLLDWTQFTHSVAPAGMKSKQAFDLKVAGLMRPPALGSGNVVAPETSLELPWGLYLSPHEDEWWSNKTQPLTSNGRTELWHTRLRGEYTYGGILVLGTGAQALLPGIPPIGGGTLPPIGMHESAKTVRAVWARHYDTRLTSDPAPDAPISGLWRNSFTTSFSDGATTVVSSPTFPFFRVVANDVGGIKERWSVVDLSGRYHDKAIGVNNLMLTSLGAWLDSHGSWETDVLATQPGISISTELLQWDHRATMGRDQYVKIVKFGRIFPWGHKAVEITITERKVKPGNPFAFLEQQKFIMVREPVLTYSLESANFQRDLPFKRVELKTLNSPPIDGGTVAGVPIADAYWIKLSGSGQEMQWAIEATDWDDKVHKFTMPLIYVRGYVAGAYAEVPFSTAGPRLTACATAMAARSITMSGQKIALAKNPGASVTDAQARVMPVTWMKFSAKVVDQTVPGDTRFYPRMAFANVTLDTMEEITNQSAGATIKFADIYKNNAYGGTNAVGKVFADIVSAPTVGFPADLTGALATPIPKLTGIAAEKGTFGGDPTQFGGGNFSPADFFDVLNAKLVGGVTLLDVLGTTLGLDKMPVFEQVRDIADTKTLVVQFTWSTPVKSAPILFVARSGAQLTLTGQIKKKLDDATAPPSYYVKGELTNFNLDLIGPDFSAIILEFSAFTFESLDGATPTVNPQISDVKFVGALKYLAELAKYASALSSASSALALSDPAAQRAMVTLVDTGPLKIDVTGAGVSASLTIAIPDLTIGVFSLRNMSFFAGLTLPFNGDPVVLDFSFCSREQPFELMVMGMGGGGYVALSFDTKGLRSVEISLEFGIGTSFGIGGIASGMVEIKGGLRILMERVTITVNGQPQDGQKLQLTVFIRIHGSIDILGLITCTLTFYLELTYETGPKSSGVGEYDKLTGTATLTIEIEILFFTIPVNLTVTKELAGKDPTFVDAMPLQSDWDAYCAAFAPARLGA